MKVVVVYEFDSCVLGVYTSREKAVEMLSKDPSITFYDPLPTDAGKPVGQGSYNFLFMDEFDVDDDGGPDAAK